MNVDKAVVVTDIYIEFDEYKMFSLVMAVNKYSFVNDFQVEFMCGLVQMSVEKLQCDLEEVQYDDTLFSHTVDEALGYERELRQVHSYPLSLPGPLHVLTQAQLFVKWIRMEKKC